jgi:hypothetical protein
MAASFYRCPQHKRARSEDVQGWQARKPPITDEKWAQNLVGYYRDEQKWSADPHLFVTPAGIRLRRTRVAPARTWSRLT